MDLALFAAAFVMFFVSHGIGDYWTQTDWQAQNKSKYPVALWRHVATYTLTFVPAVLALIALTPLKLWSLPLILLAVGLPHAALDNRKIITWFCEKTKGWRKDNMVEIVDEHGLPALRGLNPWEIAVRFHVTIALDQKAHFLCLALLSAVLASFK